jgi:outer membrane protein
MACSYPGWARSARLLSAMAAAFAVNVVVLPVVHAQGKTAPDPTVRQLVRDAVERFAQRQNTQAPDASGSTGPARSLTVDEAVKIALERNLDIAVERLNPQLIDFSLAGLKASYLPTFGTLIGDLHQTSTPITLLAGGQEVNTSTATVNGQFMQNFPWGSNLDVTWNNNRVSSNSFFYNYNPAYNSVLSAQFTQPLLRGRHTDAVRQQLSITKINRSISDLQLQTTITNTVTAVRDAYWDLVLAVESIDVARASVDVAHQFVEDAQKRVQAGAMTRLDLVTATSQEATDRHTLVLAEGARRTAEVALKRLLVAGPDDEFWRAVIDPVDRPDDTTPPIDLEAALTRALQDRSDLAQAKQQVTANETTLRYLDDQTRPRADVVANYSVAGLGGAQLVRGGDLQDPASIFTAPVIGTIPGAYGSALSSLFGHDYPAWGIALNVTYPVGYSAAKAEAARARVQASQVVAQTHRLEVQVVTDVTNAAITARNAFDEIDTAKQARALAEQKLDAEQRKFASGVSTNYLVVQAQRDLTDARNAVLRAEITHQKALVDFERAQHTSLQSAGVTIISGNRTGNAAVGSGLSASPAPSGSFVP